MRLEKRRLDDGSLPSLYSTYTRIHGKTSVFDVNVFEVNKNGNHRIFGMRKVLRETYRLDTHQKFVYENLIILMHRKPTAVMGRLDVRLCVMELDIETAS